MSGYDAKAWLYWSSPDVSRQESQASGQTGSDGNGQAVTGRSQDVMCKKPYRKGVMEFGCGQCMPCRINKQRTWVARLQLELATCPVSCFVTLTYNEEHVPKDGSISKRHVQLFLKRLREKLAPRKVRFFIVGEYGERTWRPHYHAILYGVSIAESELVASAWGKGFAHVGTAEPASMSYVSGYVTKKMTKKTDKRLQGRHPEFCLMSLRPGIGRDSIQNLATAYRTAAGKAAIEKNKWISTSVRIGTKIYPMGRYLSGKLAAELGLSDEDRKRHNSKIMMETYLRKLKQTTTAYEKERKAKCQQQEGKVKYSGAKWRKTL